MSDFVSLEEKIFAWLTEILADADKLAAYPILAEVAAHETTYEAITTRKIVQVGPTDSRLFPDGGGGIEELDATVVLILLVGVADIKSNPSFADARKDLARLEVALAACIGDDPSLGNRVDYTLAPRAGRAFSDGNTKINGFPYAVGNLTLRINFNDLKKEGNF